MVSTQCQDNAIQAKLKWSVSTAEKGQRKWAGTQVRMNRAISLPLNAAASAVGRQLGSYLALGFRYPSTHRFFGGLTPEYMSPTYHETHRVWHMLKQFQQSFILKASTEKKNPSTATATKKKPLRAQNK